MDLEQIRNKIDKIDDEILILLLKRMNYSKIIAKIKYEKNIQIYDEFRENEILNRIKSKSADDYTYILPVFLEVLNSSKILQNDIIKNTAKN